MDKVFQREEDNRTIAAEYKEMVDEFVKHHDDEDVKSDTGREVLNHTIENLFGDLSFVAWDNLWKRFQEKMQP